MGNLPFPFTLFYSVPGPEDRLRQPGFPSGTMYLKGGCLLKKETPRKPAARASAPARQKRSTGKRAASAVGRVVVTILLIGIITGSLMVGAIGVYVLCFVKPYNISLDNSKLKSSSFMYATDSSTGQQTQIAELSGDYNSVWVNLSDVPDNLKNAVISTEDKRFNEHEGVDITRSAGAFFNLLFHFHQSAGGGSTITQQLVKNLEGNFYNRTVPVKIREIVTALSVEKKYSKNQILEAYLNTITMNNNCYGVQAAANLYFGKNVKDLDLAQCATLAGITQNPVSYDPYKHPDNLKKRKEYVLRNMLAQKMITQAQYDAAVAENLTYSPKPSTLHSWFVDMVIKDVANDLVSQKGYTYSYALNQIYTQGYRIYTTEDTRVQAAMDAVYQNIDYWSKGPDGNYYNSAMMITDYSGKIVGVEGDRGQKTGNMVTDFANDIPRQPGSSIKPLAVYGPAIDAGLINWSTAVKDGPVTTVNGRGWPYDGGKNSPDWDEGSDGGYRDIPVVEALARSKNAVAAQIMQRLTPTKSFNFLTGKLGFTTLVKSKTIKNKVYSDIGVYLAIGAVTDGVTVREMTGGYQIFGNGGVYTKPYSYTKVTDAGGNVVLEQKPTYTQAVSPETATIVNKLLQQDIQRADGTAVRLKGLSFPAGGKTGTTTENYDRWFCGVTPDYVGVCWTGYKLNKDMTESTNPAMMAWKYVMTKVESGMAAKDFSASGNVVQANYDSNTGQVTAGGDSVGWYSASDPALSGSSSGSSSSGN